MEVSDDFQNERGEMWRRTSVNGRPVSDQFIVDGTLDRDQDRPSETTYYGDTGYVKTQTWFQHGVRNRGGGKPAVIHYRNEREPRILAISFWKNGLPATEGDHPASIMYYKNGVPKRARWYGPGGLRHRDGGKPAEVHYDEQGVRTRALYFQNGELLK
jgi:hypothetical protein